MEQENQTPVAWETASSWISNIISKVKWLFHKSEEWSKNPERKTRAFALSRKDSIVAVVIAILVVVWAVFYWMKVLNDYRQINSETEELKYISTYNLTPDKDILSPYLSDSDGEKITVNWMVSAYKNVDEELKANELFERQQQSYYKILLQNIYLPSLNVWKDPYTKAFDMTILWQKYLESDKFQDLYLIQYWSDFVKYVWNDADYNNVEWVVIWEKVEVEDSDYFYTPITVSFLSPNKRSFLLLVNKLSITSNQTNISLLNEFFFYLLLNIKDMKADTINQLEQEYREIFSSNSNWELPENLSELTDDEEISNYRDRVIWYNLYHWLNDENSETDLIDDEVIVKTIRDVTLCSNSENDQNCSYNFRSKYRDIPYLAYNVGLEKQTDRTAWLKSFLQDLPPVLAITDFSFEKYSNSSFLNNEEEQYEWKVTFNAYWRNITDEELEEAASLLWKLCFWNNSDQKMSVSIALERLSGTMWSKWWERDYSDVTSLWELQWLLTKIEEWYDKMANYEKMIKLFEIRRMLNDANLCAN